MGSEQSNLHSNQRQSSLNRFTKPSNIRRQHTIANPVNIDDKQQNFDDNRPGSISPGPSVCSDIDLPYISYTVNRPIGDSPKLTNKQIVKQTTKRKIQQQKTFKKSSSTATSSASTTHNIVVVKQAPQYHQQQQQQLDKDPDILRLQNIPMFLPIMRATINLPAVRDPEVLERLDPLPLYKLCNKYQQHLTLCANLIATEQNQLTQKIREIDCDIIKIINNAQEKQKKYGKYAEKFNKIQELSHQLNRCHMLLNQTLESMETLNNYLDIDDRLEPFIWTTG